MSEICLQRSRIFHFLIYKASHGSENGFQMLIISQSLIGNPKKTKKNLWTNLHSNLILKTLKNGEIFLFQESTKKVEALLFPTTMEGLYLMPLPRFTQVYNSPFNYIEMKWNPEWFTGIRKFPKSHWKSFENRKNFVEKLASRLQIKKPSDWGKISSRTIRDIGGSTLLTNYYNNSLFACLHDVQKGVAFLAFIL